MSSLSKEQKLAFSKYFCETAGVPFDESATKGKRQIGLERTKHRKTRAFKSLIKVFNGTQELNTFPEWIKVEEKPKRKQCLLGNKQAPKECAFLEWSLTNYIPEGTGRHFHLLPNATAYFKGNEQAQKQWIETQRANPACFLSWKKHDFNCHQLREYARNIGKAQICDLCLLQVVME